MRLPGRANQYGRMRIRHHVLEPDPAGFLEQPAGDTIGSLREGRLKRLQVLHALQQQSGPID